MSQEILELKELLAELPEVTLPESLTPEALWARMDAGELPGEQQRPRAPLDNVIDLTRRMRPALSYAAVFILMVAVYYGTGMDRAALDYSSAAPAPVAMDMAAAEAAPAAAPRMASPQVAGQDAIVNEAETANLPREDAASKLFSMGAAAAQPYLVAVVQVGETVVLELDLSQTPDGEITLPEESGIAMTLEVRDGAIGIVKADCMDQQCVQAGFISQPRAMVCCLKDQVLITLEERP